MGYRRGSRVPGVSNLGSLSYLQAAKITTELSNIIRNILNISAQLKKKKTWQMPPCEGKERNERFVRGSSDS
jgi:hypothetical protein